MKTQLFDSLSRRDWARLAAAGMLGGSASGWFEQLASGAAAAAVPARKPKSCILLWMDGGPSHIDTFDPKPEGGSEFNGEKGAIDTSVPGLKINENLPKIARVMQLAAVLRGMSTLEADHDRARIYMHTGYRPGFGGVNYPPLGSLVSSELGDPEFALPNFVVTGEPLNKYSYLTSAGYLGPRHQALAHAYAGEPLENLNPPPAADDFAARAAVLAKLEESGTTMQHSASAAAHRTTFARAVKLMQSDRCRAFDLSQESAATREAYGADRFGEGCLLARRLVDVGVRFVEVYLANWDTHEKRSADAIQERMPAMDQAVATLVTDLADRGMLDDVLIVWMGEFGRTPRINRNGGRDHYATAWSSVLFGGGIRGGQAIGETDDTGTKVVDRPISAINFMASLCKILGIDYQKQFPTPGGRPIRIVDTGAEPLSELFA